MDFTVNIDRAGEIRLLQLTDMQVIDSSKQRYEGRLRPDEAEKWAHDKRDLNLYDHIRKTVAETDPDLIFITGDITYGSFDDDGESLTDFISFMESFGIPWAPVYGNHDNESKMGVDWQNAQFEAAPHCLFKKGSVTGNGNYSVGICQNGTLIRLLCMMDSHGCGVPYHLTDDQLAWLKAEASAVDVPVFVAMHVPSADVSDALVDKGYQAAHDTREATAKYDFSADLPAKDGDFGRKQEWIPRGGKPMLEVCPDCGIDGLFFGHYHKVNLSITWHGVRITFGMKTGTYDYHFADGIGGTLVRLSGGDFTVEHHPSV